LTNATQAVSSAEAGVNQNQASLTLKTSSARPEDVVSAEAQVSNASGAVQIAQSAYQNRIITSPGNGIATAVYISAGQIASPNVPAIDLSGETVSKNVSLMIPNNSIIDRAGKFYVLIKSGSGTEEKEITIGSSDATNTEVLSGILAGDEVATH
jgi:multidrug efflux pump subunit AcrA (membrane-fusion protein)